jgi:hypothetical protein
VPLADAARGDQPHVGAGRGGEGHAGRREEQERRKIRHRISPFDSPGLQANRIRKENHLAGRRPAFQFEGARRKCGT